MTDIITVSLDIQISGPDSDRIIEAIREWVKEYGYIATDYILEHALNNHHGADYEAWHDAGRVKDRV